MLTLIVPLACIAKFGTTVAETRDIGVSADVGKLTHLREHSSLGGQFSVRNLTVG